MGNLARKIIDAVQNAMLDRLFVRLFPLLWIASAWEDLSSPEFSAGTLILIFGVAGVWLLYSLLEAVADQTPKPRQRSPYDQVHVYPSDKFQVSDQPPQERLRPPAFIRSLVMTLGAGGRSWISIVEGLMFIGAVALTWTLAHKSQSFWTEIDPRLADQTFREQVFLAASVILTAVIVRGWAVEQRQRLSPSTARVPVLGSILLGIVFAAVFGAGVSDLLGFSPLVVAVAGVGLLAVAVGPSWREKVLEFLFGKREPADTRP
ncbi:MAG: hypothetical protein KAY29_02205 [Brevundimonas sp.]|nr:hypothetical protein [Brevundimonas sp.]